MGFWRAVDWQRAWLVPYRALGEAVCTRLAAGEPVAEALDRVADAERRPRLAAGPLRFVAQSTLPAGEAYEAFIHRSACVPTRDNLHDLFNGLVWLRFPSLKRHLNALQAGQIARAGIGATRGALRDALTVFDENGALWRAPAPLVQALAARDWLALFVGGRPLWPDARLTLVGHALLEKLVQPRKPITAHVVVVDGDPAGGSADAERLAGASFTAERLAAKPFLPLPVLGVPGWWPDNATASFYDDPAVFRPPAAGS